MATGDEIKQSIQFRQIGAKIAYYRTLRGLQQDELARLANISKSVLSRIERGKYNNNVPVSALLVISEILRIEPSLFLSFNEEEKRMWWEDLSLEYKLPNRAPIEKEDNVNGPNPSGRDTHERPRNKK